MLRWTQILLLGSLLAACVALGGTTGCRKNQEASKAPSNIPTIRIYAISTLAGALEPCGCVKNMLGGVDHAAALIDKGKAEAPNAVVLGAGPLLFMNPELKADKKTQDLWKAEAIANALSDMGLAAWAPGTNDFADGTETLKQLRGRAQANLLAANVTLLNVDLKPTRIVDVAGYKVGIAGISSM
jgi:2',3'-cyclic-nucleotide 2'-phosphodiesterase (5'-nucleotidase family)